MKYSSVREGVCLPFGFCLLVFFLASCSMQKSKMESAHVDNKAAALPAKPLNQESSQDKVSLKVDYLTPVAAITSPELFVYKGKRRLYIIQSKVLVRDYPIGLGFHPKGDKEKEGDGRTPEGEFRICMKNSGSRFVKSLGLNYPDKKHAERAFFAGVLPPSEFRNILLAFEKGATPPWDTSLGGEIFIHAGGAHNDWTDGCIALYDSDMEELFRIANLGTPISIRP